MGRGLGAAVNSTDRQAPSHAVLEGATPLCVHLGGVGHDLHVLQRRGSDPLSSSPKQGRGGGGGGGGGRAPLGGELTSSWVFLAYFAIASFSALTATAFCAKFPLSRPAHTPPSLLPAWVVNLGRPKRRGEGWESSTHLLQEDIMWCRHVAHDPSQHGRACQRQHAQQQPVVPHCQEPQYRTIDCVSAPGEWDAL